MAQSNSEKLLDSLFYEADAAHIGAKSEENAGRASEKKQPFLWYCQLIKRISIQNF